LTERFCTTGAQIIIDLLSGQNEQQALSHGHRAPALSTVKGGSTKIFELAHLIFWDEVGFRFAFAHDVGNDGIEDDNRRFRCVNVHNKAVAIVVKKGL
jgi:hypothetical protein